MPLHQVIGETMDVAFALIAAKFTRWEVRMGSYKKKALQRMEGLIFPYSWANIYARFLTLNYGASVGSDCAKANRLSASSMLQPRSIPDGIAVSG